MLGRARTGRRARHHRHRRYVVGAELQPSALDLVNLKDLVAQVLRRWWWRNMDGAQRRSSDRL